MEEFNNTEQTTAVPADVKPPFNWKKEALDWVTSIAVALIIALLIRRFVFTLVRVDGPSMNPTLTHNDTLFTSRLMYTPKVGDIIIFRPPASPKTPYVKRVIATEGQTVDIDPLTGTVTVDGKAYDEPYIAEPIQPSRMGDMEYPFTVPEGTVFVLGDNRNNSHDSRDSDVGAVPVKNIIGKAQFRLLPLSTFGSLYK
mgnify:FL=1